MRRQRAKEAVYAIAVIAGGIALSENWLPRPVRIAWGLLLIVCLLVLIVERVTSYRARRKARRHGPPRT